MSESRKVMAWYVAHTRPRCEKKLAEYCEREGFAVTLPVYKSTKVYASKTATFQKPLFPNYVFLQLLPEQRKKVYQSDYVANLLDVPDQKTFEEQLSAILTALESDYEIVALPHIAVGRKVKIKSGVLRGMEGFVEDRQGTVFVLLRLDFIAQSAAIRVEAGNLELVE